MAVISPSSFDAMRDYVNVRLAQGVPIADADWNEMDDIRKFELRAFLKWFVGDGVAGTIGTPKPSYFAFNVNPAPTPANNFLLRSGVFGTPDALTNAGRCLVGGWEIRITADLIFTDQPLHAGKGASAAALAAKLGVPVIDAITTPAADGSLTVYVDAWEHIVGPADDPSLVLAGLGTETCSRVKREWVVRARAAAGAPAPGDADCLSGHCYMALASVARHATVANINAGDISDLRRKVISLEQAGERIARLEQLLLAPMLAASPDDMSPKVGIPGTNVMIRGKNFLATGADPRVTMGGADCIILSTDFSDTLMHIVVPALVAGSYPVVVGNEFGIAVTAEAFQVINPGP